MVLQRSSDTSGFQVSSTTGSSFYVSLSEVASGTSVEMRDDLERAIDEIVDVFVSSTLGLPLNSRDLPQ